MIPQLALGTAQFGLDYGITNSIGQVNSSTAVDLLEHAQSLGISFIDTAQAYGNAEQVLGDSLPSSHNYRIISKLPSQQNLKTFDQHCFAIWEKSLERSLQLLQVQSLDGFLLHDSRDLVRPDASYLFSWLCSVRNRGLVRRIGVSIYSAGDLNGLPMDHIQLVQLPCSLFDQRLIHDGTVTSLISRGIAVHARSLYLQGLLVTPPEFWPRGVSSAFRSHHEKLYSLAQANGWSLVQLALVWARRQQWIEAAVVGVTSLAELLDLSSAWSGDDPWSCGSTAEWAWPVDFDLDPRNWG